MVGAVFGPTRLALQLERAGHSVHAIDVAHDPGAIQQVDLVVLDGDVGEVEGGVEKLEPYARPQQMFLHTALAAGPQLLDDVETSRAIAMCAHNLFGDVWVTSAADEVGETVVGLLVNELGGTNMPVNDADRPAIVAAQRLRALESVLRADAFDLLTGAIPAMDVFGAEFADAPSGQAGPQATGELEAVFAAIEDPGVRRLYVDMERRRAEQTRSTDAELWAYEKYGRYEGTI